MGWVDRATSLWQQYGQSYPLDFVLGVFKRESGGNNADVEPDTGEAGWGQIHPTEARKFGIDLDRVATDESYSFRAWIQVMDGYRSRVDATSYSDTAYWGMVKLWHTLPVLAERADSAVKGAGKVFTDWSDLSSYIQSTQPSWIPDAEGTLHRRDKWLGLVDDVLSYGAMLAQGVPAAIVPFARPKVLIPLAAGILAAFVWSRGKS